jgi:hypothetical protein
LVHSRTTKYFFHKPFRRPASERTRQLCYGPGHDRQHVGLQVAALLDQRQDRRDVGIAVIALAASTSNPFNEGTRGAAASAFSRCFRFA